MIKYTLKHIISTLYKILDSSYQTNYYSLYLSGDFTVSQKLTTLALFDVLKGDGSAANHSFLFNYKPEICFFHSPFDDLLIYMSPVTVSSKYTSRV